jgi:putative hemolysin
MQTNGFEKAGGILAIMLFIFAITGGVYLFIASGYKVDSKSNAGQMVPAKNLKNEIVCVEACGDGLCDEIVCQAEGCPCAETPESCPEDCPDAAGLANPATEYCLNEPGAKHEMRETEEGTAGYCLFQDGSSCEEWAFYRQECLPDYNGS